MKKFSKLHEHGYFSVKGLDARLIERFQHLNGKLINECCGDCCYDEPCSADYCEQPVCTELPSVGTSTPTPVSYNSFGRFNSTTDVTRELDTNPKVSTLYDIHSQFGGFTFNPDPSSFGKEPLYFGLTNPYVPVSGVSRESGDMPGQMADDNDIDIFDDSLSCVPAKNNKKIYKIVTDLCEAHDLSCPVIETKINGEVQVYTVKHSGTNGEECSIKSSLEDVADILDKLDRKSEIRWSQVLDISIDNIDDLYSFLITFVFENSKVRETSNKIPTIKK